MGRFLNVLFLAGLGAAAANIPQKMKGVLDAGKPTTITTQMTSIDHAALADLNEADRQYLQDMAPKVETHINPIMAGLLRIPKKREFNPETRNMKSQDFLDWRDWVARNKIGLILWMFRLTMALLIGGAFLYIVGLKGLGRTLVTLCNSLSQKWLFLISLGAAILYVTQSVNLWSVFPVQFWAIPVIGILVSIFFLSIIDMNYPTWNSAVSGFSAPLLACLIILLWDKARPLLPF